MKMSKSIGKIGFTLIELLVVVTIIGILASLLLPSFSRAKQQAWKVVCLNNLRQGGISIKLYLDDQQARFPSKWVHDLDLSGNSELKSAQVAMGGRDPQHPLCLETYPQADARPLYQYMARSGVYACPADRGQAQKAGCRLHPIKASNFEVVGCSYQYNAGIAWGFRDKGTRSRQADRQDGLSGKPEWWAPEPSRFILMYEPPARPYVCGFEGDKGYCQWHFSRGQSDFADPRTAGGRFFSPILFVDGHTAFHDFTRALCADPAFPFEPTKDWMWYKPATN
jgi:prepilin-type N-terminal cleavage/methylation domain-containing protein